MAKNTSTIPTKEISELSLDELVALQKNIAAAVKKKEEQKARMVVLDPTKTKFQETYLNVTDLVSFDTFDVNKHLSQLVEHIHATIKYAEIVASSGNVSFSIDVANTTLTNYGYGFDTPYAWNSSNC